MADFTKTGISPASVVDIFLTYDCNNVCPYCFVRDRGTDLRMEPFILDRAVDWVAESAKGEVNLVFLGGEPTLEPELIKRAVMRAREWEKRINLRFHFTMTTNAINIDEDLAKKLSEWRVHYMVSVDGYGARHDFSRPTKSGASSFDDLRKKFPILKMYQPRIPARVTTIPQNVDWLCEDLQELYKLGFNQFIVSPVTGIVWPENKLKRFVTELSKFASSRETVDGRLEPRLLPVDEPPRGYHAWGCGAGRGRYSVDPSGNIFACARFVEIKAEQGLVLGDIFSGIDFRGNIQKFLDESYESRPECYLCSLRELCLGGCPAVNYHANGSTIMPASEECRLSKAILEILDKAKKQTVETLN